MRAIAVSACSPPESRVSVGEALARRLRHDLEPGLERIVGFDQLEMRLAALEQGGEQAAEMAVDVLEGGEQAGAALAVQAADRAAQAVDRLAQFLALGLARRGGFPRARSIRSRRRG